MKKFYVQMTGGLACAEFTIENPRIMRSYPFYSDCIFYFQHLQTLLFYVVLVSVDLIVTFWRSAGTTKLVSRTCWFRRKQEDNGLLSSLHVVTSTYSSANVLIPLTSQASIWSAVVRTFDDRHNNESYRWNGTGKSVIES
jgi:hypothetical protein